MARTWTCVAGVWPDGTADQWGCYRSADTEVDALHTAMPEFRARIGGRAALPHALD
jgi:hypothetical protein